MPPQDLHDRHFSSVGWETVGLREYHSYSPSLPLTASMVSSSLLCNCSASSLSFLLRWTFPGFHRFPGQTRPQKTTSSRTPIDRWSWTSADSDLAKIENMTASLKKKVIKKPTIKEAIYYCRCFSVTTTAETPLPETRIMAVMAAVTASVSSLGFIRH